MRRAAVAVVFSVAALAAWFLWPKGAGGPKGVGGGGTEAVAAADGSSAEAAGSTAPGPGLATGSRPTRGSGTSLAGSAPKGDASIVGTVRRGSAPERARVEARFVMDPRESPLLRRSGVGFFQSLLAAPVSALPASAVANAGEDGHFEFRGLGQGVWSVTAVAEDGARGTALVGIPADGARVEANPVLVPGTETLKGKVVHADGRRFEGLVVLSPGGEEAFANLLFGGGSGAVVTLDAEGRFTATGLAAGETVVVAIVPGQSFGMSMPVALPHAGEFVFTVDGANSVVEGRVVADADSSPIAGAEVLCGGSGGQGMLALGRATTDATGAFRLALSADKDSGLFVQAAGYAPQTAQRKQATSGPVEVRLSKAARIEGRVTPEGDGKGVPGLTVRASAVRSGDTASLPEPSTTDAEGRYAIADLPPCEVTLLASGSGWVTKGAGSARGEGFNPLAVTVKSGETTTFDLVVVRGAVAQGQVLDSAGQPVAGAVVRAQSVGGAEFRGPPVFDGSGQVSATGADGAFAFDTLVAGTSYRFDATVVGYPSASAGPLTAAEGTPIAVELRLPPPRFVEVSVLDAASGSPIPGADVRPRIESASTSGENQAFDSPSATTGADGKARVGPLGAGRLTLTASAPDYYQKRDEVKPTPDDATTAVVRLRRGNTVAGKVRKPDGTPATGVRVSASAEGVPDANEMTTADGSFRLRGLPAGPVTLEATNYGSESLRATATVNAGQEDVVLTLAPASGGTPEKRGEALLVTVMGPDGKPVPRAKIRIVTADGGSSGTSVLDGKAQFTGDVVTREGAIEVWAATGSGGAPLPYGPARLERRKGQGGGEVEIHMPAEVAIAGFVRDGEGRSVRGALVQAMNPPSTDERRRSYDSTAVSSGRSGDDGAFRVGSLGSGEYVLKVLPPPGTLGPDDVRARGGQSGVELRLRPALSVSVTVRDSDGKPVPGASVGVNRSDTRKYVAVSGDATPRTDANGVARLVDLDPQATYELAVTPPRNRSDLRTPPSVRDWRPHDDAVRLERGYGVKGVVRDQTGRPIANANVQWKEGESWRGVESAEDGTFTVAQVPAGTVVLKAQAGIGMMWRPGAAGTAADQGVTVVAGSENVVLVVDMGLELLVTVEDAGRDWLSARLTREGAAGMAMAHGTVREGVARFCGLRSDETYALWIGGAEDGRMAYRTGVRAGGDLKVRLEPGKTITVRVTAPSGATNVNAAVQGQGLSVGGRTLPDGRVEIRGIPDGTWKVVASAQVGNDWWFGEATASAGSSLDIEVKPRSPR